MATLSELQVQLQEAKFQLRYARPVNWGSPNSGMLNYGHRLQKVLWLQQEIRRVSS